MYQQSIAWWCFEKCGLSPKELVHAAAEIGYTGIELAPRELWQQIRDQGLAISALSGHGSIVEGLNRRAHHARIERELLSAIRDAGYWQIPVLICFSGSRGGISDAEGAEMTADGLRRVARAAEDAGVTLALELLNSRVDHPDYQCDRTSWGVQVCELVGSPRVKLLYDIYHAQIMEGDIIRTVQQHHTHFGHYHTAGNPGRHEIDDTQEVNYPAVMRAIAATGYTGWVAQEFIPRGEPLAALRDAFARCR